MNTLSNSGNTSQLQSSAHHESVKFLNFSALRLDYNSRCLLCIFPLRSAHFGPVLRLWDPVSRPPRLHPVRIQLVYLFQRQPFGFGNKKVRKYKTAETRRTPDEKYFDSKTGIARACVNEIWYAIADHPVPQPVGSSRHRHRFCTNTLS